MIPTLSTPPLTRVHKPLGHSVLVKVALAVLFFVPALTAYGYDPVTTPQVVSAVLSNPLSIVWLPALPVAKLLLLGVGILALVSKRDVARFVLGYYAIVLLIVGIFQNMAVTNQYGFTWLVGNTLLQFIIAAFCFADLAKGRSTISRASLNRKWLWVLLPMALALLFPYNVDSVQASGIISPDFGPALLYNDTGLTFCMITPVMLGILIIHSSGVDSALMSVVSFVALGFGLLNMVSWFVLEPQNWWMGVLHTPLMVLSVYGLILARKGQARRASRQAH
jgi:hypothetical protein